MLYTLVHLLRSGFPSILGLDWSENQQGMEGVYSPEKLGPGGMMGPGRLAGCFTQDSVRACWTGRELVHTAFVRIYTLTDLHPGALWMLSTCSSDESQSPPGTLHYFIMKSGEMSDSIREKKTDAAVTQLMS